VPWPVLMVNAVGGSTVHYPGLSIRFQPWNFRGRSGVLERYGAGAIPAGSTLADWPLDYEELEPYYDAVEHAIGVSGRAANVAGEHDPEGNELEGPRRRGYPMPPLRRTGWTELTAAAARDLGWHPFPAPAAINAEPYNGNPGCTYCGFCSANGCYVDAKGSTDANVIRWAEATGRLRVETSARVTRIEVDGGGLATGVTYVQDGRERFQPAKVVLLGAFTYENTRLLLLSASTAFPHGLANNHGQVGKHFAAHVTPVAFGVFPGRRLNLFNGLWSQATCLEDWNADNFDHAELGFVGGAMLTAPQEAKPIAVASGPVPPPVSRWGSEWKAWLHRHAQSIGSVVAQFDTLTYETNFLDLDPAVTDPHGVPVVRVTWELRENERRGFDFMRERLHEWLLAAGAAQTWSPDGYAIEGRHCYGGTRMGNDPAMSVVDRHGLAHEVPNLGALGASTFPAAGGSNPTLTVQALAWRTAQHVVNAWPAIVQTP
jgi:gluconate 2-dehydrogenase alpha chain